MNTNTRYKLAGVLSIAMAVLGIPMVISSLVIEYAQRTGAISGLAGRSATAALSIAAYGIGIFLFAALRHLFETRYGFYEVSRLLAAFIWLSVALAICTALGVISDRIELLAGLLSFLGVIAFGIMGLVFGIRLLRMDSDLYGMRNPYAYASIVSGVCYAAILLIPVGLLVDIAGGIFAAIIFFRESERPGATPGEIAPIEGVAQG